MGALLWFCSLKPGTFMENEVGTGFTSAPRNAEAAAPRRITPGDASALDLGFPGSSFVALDAGEWRSPCSKSFSWSAPQGLGWIRCSCRRGNHLGDGCMEQ